MHPILYQIPTPWGPLTLWSHGACLAAATLVGWYLWVKPTSDVPASMKAKRYLAGVGFGVVVGKLLHSMLSDGTLFEGGIASAGILLGAVFVFWLARDEHDDAILGTIAPLAPLFVFFSALGQWLHGSAFGARFAGPAFLERLGTYPAWMDGTGAPAWRAHLDLPWFDAEATASLPTHPVQLYEAVGAAVLLFVVWRRPPHALALALAGIGALQVGLEPLRHQASYAAYIAPIALVALSAFLWRSPPSPSAGSAEEE